MVFSDFLSLLGAHQMWSIWLYMCQGFGWTAFFGPLEPLIGIILQFGWNRENFPYLFTSSDGVKGIDKLSNFEAATDKAAAHPYLCMKGCVCLYLCVLSSYLIIAMLTCSQGTGTETFKCL